MVDADGARRTDADTGRPPAARGVWCTDSTPGAVARMARSGPDWVCLDLQHGRYGRRELIEVARAVTASGHADRLAVRVASAEFTGVGLALDVGARTVIVPQVDSPAIARAAVDATFYPPVGRRSWGPLTPDWGVAALRPEEANAAVTCAVMIESAEALRQVDEIAAVPGVGMLFVGPFDLSLSLGTTVPALLADGSAGAPLARIRDAARGHGLRAGAFGGEPGRADAFEGHGFDWIAWTTDAALLDAAVSATFGDGRAAPR